MTTSESKPSESRSRARASRFPVIALAGFGAILLFFVALGAAYAWFHWERWEFEKKVRVGMTKSEVEAVAGAPRLVLFAGDTLPKWGATEPRVVGEETWVYHREPVHRFIVTIRDDVVVSIDYDQT